MKQNKGIGACGVNTNYYGKKFEEKTNNEIRLLDDGYIRNTITLKSKSVVLVESVLSIEQTTKKSRF